MCIRDSPYIASKQSSQLLFRQIRHHFLFNTLNTTVCLIDDQPDQAKSNLIKLAKLYRAVLDQTVTSTLEEEIEMTECYLEIEKVRLGERLQVRWDLRCDHLLETQVPPMLLQPLVENAVYHGVETLSEGEGAIDIVIKEDIHNSISFKITNPVGLEDLSSGSLCTHINLEKRLILLYGRGNFRFVKTQRADYYCTEITLSKEKTNI